MPTVERLVDLIRSANNSELRSLLEKDPGLIKEKIAGISLLQLAAYCRNADALDILRRLSTRLDVFEAATLGDLTQLQQRLQEDSGLILAHSGDGFTLLGLAAYFAHQNVVEFLLAAGADPNVPSANAFKVTPLHSACAISHLNIAETLIESGALLNVRQSHGITPLHSAAHNGAANLVELLIRHGADVNAKTDSGQTPLDMAQEKGHHSVAQLIQDHGGF